MNFPIYLYKGFINENEIISFLSSQDKIIAFIKLDWVLLKRTSLIVFLLLLHVCANAIQT